MGAVAAILAGCGDDTATGLRKSSGNPGVGTNGGDNQTAPAATPAETACAAAPAATALSDVKNAGSAFIVGKAVFFQSGTKILRVLKDGTGKKEIIDSPNMVGFYADKNALVLVETTGNAPEATIRVINAINAPAAPAEGQAPPPEPEFPEFPADLVTAGGAIGGIATATALTAAGARAFASDTTSFYLMADDANGATTIIKSDKANPAAQTTILATNNEISNPQLASSALWYVRDGNRVYKIALADPANGVAQGEPTEVFGIQYAACNLAVGDNAAFCSVGTALERRDLTGGNPLTILDATKSKTPARFGKATNFSGSLFVQSEEPDAKVKHVIRAVKPSATGAEESFAACGRNMVTSLSVDSTHIVWTEKDTGLFMAVR
jgi:hypothetical protein